MIAVAASPLAFACDAYDARLLPAQDALLNGSEDGGATQRDGAVDPECESGARTCARPNADAVCVDRACSIVRCREAFVDCDGVAANGCEAALDSLEHCGACNASCLRGHVARARCDLAAAGNSCAIDAACPAGDPQCIEDDPSNGCEPGYGDCDGQPDNGCETSLRTLNDCGACGVVCDSEESSVSCATGQCAVLGCSPGFGDCRDEGCESLASNVSHCGACDNACPEDAAMCHGGRCTAQSCAPGTADCDGQSGNGCEADLDDLWSCGACDVQCGPYAHARAGCADGRCTITSCDTGFEDCDAERENGCEADLREPQSCGGCGNDCSALPHVEAAECESGGCADLTCEPGWGDCDGDADNGCEQSLATAAHCGGCNRACALDHATSDCSSGSCVVSACADGFDDCNAQPEDGCEAALDDVEHCGSCDNACEPGNACQGGGCACVTSETCPAGTECCDGACVNTSSSCVPWPCVPGTTRDKANCGGCGVTCGGWCCAG